MVQYDCKTDAGLHAALAATKGAELAAGYHDLPVDVRRHALSFLSTPAGSTRPGEPAAHVADRAGHPHGDTSFEATCFEATCFEATCFEATCFEATCFEATCFEATCFKATPSAPGAAR